MLLGMFVSEFLKLRGLSARVIPVTPNPTK